MGAAAFLVWLGAVLGSIAEASGFLASLSIDGCAELYEIAIAQLGASGDYGGTGEGGGGGGGDVDPGLLETISVHCFGNQAT
jgi:hypothetical protein